MVEKLAPINGAIKQSDDKLEMTALRYASALIAVIRIIYARLLTLLWLSTHPDTKRHKGMTIA